MRHAAQDRFRKNLEESAAVTGMCGIVGILQRTPQAPVPVEVMRAMLQAIAHRGPDGAGYYRDSSAALGSARLSIIDLVNGDQPIGNEDGSLWIVFNGEIFNYRELRPGLEQRGHVLRTASDTEVILHLYEEYGARCLEMLNGQFAFAIWDSLHKRLFLARDRIGVRPLFYATTKTGFVFGSEIKALLAHPDVQAEIEPAALRETFVYWSPQPPRTIFRDVTELPAAHYMVVEDGQPQPPQPYWQLNFAAEDQTRPAAEYIDELDALLLDATRIRLRADVPVGAYLSGGLDSALIGALAARLASSHFDTYSLSFADPAFDERSQQAQIAGLLASQHHTIVIDEAAIGQIFPQVVWHAEAPLLRTAPAPMFLLADQVRQNNCKVVLTGEGADEFFAGYDIFKEMKLRRFWAADPTSQKRPLLFKTLYPEIQRMAQTGAFLSAFFQKDLLAVDTPYYSHATRWNTTARSLRFLADSSASPGAPPLPAGFAAWSALGQAQYLEIVSFLTPYLLSSQGDRVSMAHGVEGRYPFLDVRVMEFASRLPPSMKLPVLLDKWILRVLGKRYLPPEVARRRKRPYRAPIQRSFFGAAPPDYVPELLSRAALAESNLFAPEAVALLARKAAGTAQLSEVEEMALSGILSTQLLYRFFVRARQPDYSQPLAQNWKIIDLCAERASHAA